MKEEQLVKVQLPARPERLCLVRVLVKRAAELAGCNAELSEQLVIAVNEACMNVIEHAYKGDVTGEIILEIHNNGGSLFFRLLDQADPVDLDSVKPRDLEDLRPGGLGTHFIREIMDECHMGHLEGGTGNYLEMRKKIS
jgi:sigma-B regulation protein RsbU (phosphoserine phosphatase)